ncbi:MAG: SRPBCC family protein, partial [Solirubrobacterales bacterium]
MGMSWAEHSEEVAAPVETCFEAITDYESFPGWQNAVDRVDVIDRTDEGLGRRVRLFVDAKVRKIDYTLAYSYSPPERIEWDFVDGNGMRDVDGVYTLAEAGPGRTLATYKLGADPEIPVPGPVARRVHRQLVKRSVQDLKREAERRAAEAPAASESGRRVEEGGPGERAAEEARASSAGDWRPLADRHAPGGGEPPDAEPGLAATSLPG